jgi:hypothetical protein
MSNSIVSKSAAFIRQATAATQPLPIEKVGIPGSDSFTVGIPRPSQQIRQLEWGTFLVKASCEQQLLALERSKLELERNRLELVRQQSLMDSCEWEDLPSDRLWSDEQAATYLGMSPRWLKDSDVPKVRLPGTGKRCTVKYDPNQVKAFAKEHLTHDLTNEAIVNPNPRRTRR